MLNYLKERPEANLAPPEKDRLKKCRTGLRECGEYLEFRHFYTVGEVRLKSACFCKQHLICPLCAIRRGSKYLEKYLVRFEAIRQDHGSLKPVLITLTVKNGRNLRERYEHLAGAFKRLRDRRRWRVASSEFSKVKGWVGSFEVTKNRQEWHPHLHVFALVDSWIDQRALSAEWRAITGDSFVVDVRLVRGEPASAFAEVFKYSLKFSTMEPADTWHCYRTLRGRRLLFSAGLFRGVEVPESLLDDCAALDALPYVDLFYRYVPGAGYSLAGVQTSDKERAQA
jgi:hypothetical protein